MLGLVAGLVVSVAGAAGAVGWRLKRRADLRKRPEAKVAAAVLAQVEQAQALPSGVQVGGAAAEPTAHAVKPAVQPHKVAVPELAMGPAVVPLGAARLKVPGGELLVKPAVVPREVQVGPAVVRLGGAASGQAQVLRAAVPVAEF